MINSSYLLFMLGGGLISAGVHFLLAGGMKKRGLLAALTLLLGGALGAACARIVYCLIAFEDVLMDGLGETLLTGNMECVSYYGGVAGVIFGAALAAKCTGNKPMAALDAFAPAGALMAALARFGEYFLGTLCVGRIIENEAFQFFPLAVGVDYYGYTEWYLAVFMLAGLAYLGVFFISLKVFREKRFLRTLFYLCLPQIFLESLRNYNRLTWTQFVRVEQLLCMLCMEGILLLYGLRAAKGDKKRFLPALAGLACAGVFVGVEFALDKTNLPHAMTYGIMILFLGALGAMERMGFRRLE